MEQPRKVEYPTIPSVSEELRDHAEREKYRRELIQKITKSTVLLQQDKLMFEVLEELLTKAGLKVPFTVSLAFEEAKFSYKQREDKLVFLLSQQQKHYPEDYADNVRAAKGF